MFFTTSTSLFVNILVDKHTDNKTENKSKDTLDKTENWAKFELCKV